MEKELVAYCPRCSNKLIATRFVCKECDLELTGYFELSKFNYLSSDELDFIMCFLKCQGNFKSIQKEKSMSYPAAKKKLADILINLGLEQKKTIEDEVSIVAIPTSIPILENDNKIVKHIKQKLNENGGRAVIKLLQGDLCEIWYSADGNGLGSSKIPVPNQLTWEVFNAAVELVLNKGGRAEKGNARAGKLGSDRLPLDSIEGYIAHKVHGVQEGESAFGPGFVVCAVLDWADVCKNKRGYLLILPDFLDEI